MWCMRELILLVVIFFMISWRMVWGNGMKVVVREGWEESWGKGMGGVIIEKDLNY